MLEQQICNIIEPALKSEGLVIVQVKYSNKILQIMLEHDDGRAIAIDECGKASKIISTLLDVSDMIDERYFLEVGSPGIERPLTKQEDYIRFIGKMAKVRLISQEHGRKRIKGTIINLENNKLTIKENDVEYVVDYSNISSANLVYQF